MLGMCVGEKRRFHMPPSIVYGHRGADPDVPGFVSITLDEELVDHLVRNHSVYYKKRIEKIHSSNEEYKTHAFT